MFVSRRGSGMYRTHVCAVTLAILITLLACAVGAVAAPKTEIVGPRLMTFRGADGMLKTAPHEAVSGEVLVQLKTQVTPVQFQEALARQGGTVLDGVAACGIYKISLPTGMSVVEGRAAWAAEAVAASVEPNNIAYLLFTPTDPLYPQQYQWDTIAAEAGWDVQQGSATTVVAVIDSGYDPDHEDLAGKWWQNTAEAVGTADVDDDANGFVDDINGWDFYEGDNDPDPDPASAAAYTPFVVSHGSHVAGLIGAVSGNALGGVGADWGCRIMPLRVADPLFGSLSDFDTINAINYATQMGADVINMSLGGPYTTSYDSAIAAAHAAGITVVASAGNYGVVYTTDPNTWFSPVCNDGPVVGVSNYVLGIGATDSNDVAPDWTHRDASGYFFVDVMSPGAAIWSCYYQDVSLPDLTEAYGLMDGTSMAAPIASGVVGLLVATYPAFGPDEIISQIRQTADDIDGQNPLSAGTLGAGRINMAGALGIDVPPGPATNVQAFDSPLDEGESITVTWSLSPHDGADVMSYELHRAGEDINNPGNPAPMALLTTLPPGTSSYIDTPVPDETNYWYQVVTRDAVNAVPSTVAGPAAARDDLAPDAVETVVASDRQADDGGAISVSWFGYDYPTDLDIYNIYRSEATFTNVSAMTPIGTVTDAGIQNYADTTTTDNTPYFYAVTGVDDHDNENPQVTAVGPVVSNPNLTYSYPPGLSIMAIGAMPAVAQSRRVDDILGINGNPVDLASYDATNTSNPYVVYSDNPSHPSFDQALGRAWWLKTANPIMLNISGQPAPAGDFDVAVGSGWSLLGNPFSVGIDFSITEVTGIGQGTPVDLGTSNDLGFTRDYAWGFDPFSNSYTLISGAAVDFATPTIGAGRGVFFLARRPATLVLKRPVAAAATGSDKRAEFDGWQLKIVAEAAGAADVDNYLGVTSQAAELNGIVTPPRPDADLDLYFVRPAADQARWATDFATAADNRRDWRMRVACATPGATVKLSWPDLSSMPANCRPVLVDDISGQSIYLRTSTSYSYEAAQDAAERTFTLKLGDDAGVLAITSLAASSGNGGAQLAYALSADAAVDVEVLNIAGVVVRRVLAQRQQTSGPQQVIWDGQNGAGAAAPAGTYLVRIRARTADGQQVSAVRTVQVAR